MEEKKKTNEVKTIDLTKIEDIKELKAIAFDLTEQLANFQQQLQMVRARIKQLA